MSTIPDERGSEHPDIAELYALRALGPAASRDAQAHLAECPACRLESEKLQPVVDAMVAWPTDVLRPPTSLWQRIVERLPSGAPAPCAEPAQLPDPAWEEVAPGISCKLLATDPAAHRVSMLVRLAPGVDYPPHRHGGVEELHLLQGELWIDDRKLTAGDYNRAEPGTADARVYSETGCTCVLITSTLDVIG